MTKCLRFGPTSRAAFAMVMTATLFLVTLGLTKDAFSQPTLMYAAQVHPVAPPPIQVNGTSMVFADLHYLNGSGDAVIDLRHAIAGGGVPIGIETPNYWVAAGWNKSASDYYPVPIPITGILPGNYTWPIIFRDCPPGFFKVEGPFGVNISDCPEVTTVDVSIEVAQH